MAAARQGRRFEGRLCEATLSTGDVLMLGGERSRVMPALADLGCLPLADRRFEPQPRRAVLTVLFFAAAIVAAAFDLVSAAVAFTAAVFGLVVARAVRPAEIYRSIDWSVLVLLAAMIPIGEALQSTGAARLLGEAILSTAGGAGPHAMLVVFLAATMLVTPMLNNTATVVVMSPIVIDVAARLGVSPTPFLMAVAIGASCDFLTPFGHHNNALVMGPGGYRFGDYWRVGVGLSLLVLLIAPTLIPLFWSW
jgi:di/tricarboxylate transporter